MSQAAEQKPFINSIILFFLITVIAVFYSNNTNGEKINSIVAIVNDEIITSFDVLRRTAIALQEANDQFSSAELEAKRHEFYNEAIEELINREVLIQTAQKALLKNEIKMEEIEKDLDAFIKGAVKEVGSLSKFYEIVSEQGIDPLEKKRELRDDLMVEKILKENVYGKIHVRPKMTKGYYNSHLDEFRKEKQVSFRQILIKFSKHENQNTARIEAEALINRLYQSEDFGELAKQYSHGAHAPKGGFWTFDEVKDLRKDLRDIVFALKSGDLSGIIETSLGYHIIKCEENTGDSYIPFQDVQEEIYQNLFREKFIKQKDQYVDNLKKSFHIQRY
ncbi:MAG: peptidylprolyl isomerase [Candidatus Anammoxibacter sp.]